MNWTAEGFLDLRSDLQPGLINGLKAISDNNLHKIHISILDGGMSSIQLYIISVEDKKYVLRPLKTKHSYDSRKTEVTAHNYAANLGFASKIIFEDKDLRFLIIEYIEGRVLEHKDFHDINIINKLGNILSQIHKFKGSLNQTSNNIDRVVKHYTRAIAKDVAHPSCVHKLYEEFIQEGYQIIENKENIVLCHRDLNRTNIMLDKNNDLQILDWTTATWDNKYTDLGFLAAVNGFDENKNKILLGSYFGRNCSDQEYRLLKNAIQRSYFVTSIVWFEFSESDEDKLISKDKRIEYLDRRLNSKDLRLGDYYIKNNCIVSPLTGNPCDIKEMALSFLKSYLNSNS
ncbi:MAG: phosphotransferase [Alphaproteobacteria bacterium]|nr:phosphotransferase [Alphaproteobacteria bacterium]OJV13863.1 MAG: hypothetical protein BGO27_08200 [Alphaproteobacteria bacterium 33-17]